jgi:hypothetical protein
VVSGPEFLNQYLGCLLRLNGSAAGKDVDGGITVFRPGMNGEMRLSDDDHTTHPLGTEMVEGVAEYHGAAINGGVNHDIAEKAQVV